MKIPQYVVLRLAEGLGEGTPLEAVGPFDYSAAKDFAETKNFGLEDDGYFYDFVPLTTTQGSSD